MPAKRKREKGATDTYFVELKKQLHKFNIKVNIRTLINKISIITLSK